MRRFEPFALALSVAACLSVATVVAAPADRTALKRGRAIAQQNCGQCHAVGAAGESPNPKSPPFRHLARKYPLHNLEEALGEGIVVGHEGVEMPQFRFTSPQIDAFLAYLESIQRR